VCIVDFIEIKRPRSEIIVDFIETKRPRLEIIVDFNEIIVDPIETRASTPALSWAGLVVRG
jgi:hypothetical protein